jgi:hypothetical protein
VSRFLYLPVLPFSLGTSGILLLTMDSGKAHVLIRQESILHLSNTVLTLPDSVVSVISSSLAERLFVVAPCSSFYAACFENPADKATDASILEFTMLRFDSIRLCGRSVISRATFQSRQVLRNPYKPYSHVNGPCGTALFLLVSD